MNLVDERELLPSRSLTASHIGLRLFGLLAQACSDVRILLAQCFPVGQVFGTVENDHQSAYLRTIDRHISVNAGSMAMGRWHFHLL